MPKRRYSRRRTPQIVTSTPSIEGKAINQYLGIVVGETIVATGIFRDVMAGVRDIVGPVTHRVGAE